MNYFMKLTLILLTLLLSIWTTPAMSVAFCALRDPVVKIYQLFPEATGYRSMVHEIDKHIQTQVKKAIPFTLHQDELGQHTLYMALKQKKPLGVIHSRSEVGLWGLVEIIWAFDFKLNVVDFMFQRCRESSCKLIESPPFRQLLKGKSGVELLALLENNNFQYPAIIEKNREAKALALTLIRSAIKTIEVTKITWHDELKPYLKIP